MASLMGGVPSLAIGLGALVLLASYLLDRAVGPAGLYRVEWFPLNRASLRNGAGSTGLFGLVLPSLELLGMLVAGVWCGGFGIYMTRRLAPGRRATTSIAGMMTSGAAFILAWMLIARAASW